MLWFKIELVVGDYLVETKVMTSNAVEQDKTCSGVLQEMIYLLNDK